MADVKYVVGSQEFRDKDNYDKVYKPGAEVKGLSEERIKQLADAGLVVESKEPTKPTEPKLTSADKKAQAEKEKAEADAKSKAEADTKAAEEAAKANEGNQQ